MSLMSQSTFQGLWPGRELQPSQGRLRAYTKETIPVVGCCNVNIEYNGQSAQLPLLVVGGSGPTLLGRDWLSQIRLDWHQIHLVHSVSLLAVFQGGLGTLQGYKAKILVEPGAVPRFNPARSVPYALRDKVGTREFWSRWRRLSARLRLSLFSGGTNPPFESAVTSV